MQTDPNAVAQKWLTNLSGATQAIKDGVNNVTVAPSQLAIRQVDAYAQGVQRAVADGSYVAGLQAVSKEDWQQAMLTKGVPRIATGATAAKGKMVNFLGQWLPYEEQGKQKLAAMPRGDLQTNIQRAVAMINHNAAFKLRK